MEEEEEKEKKKNWRKRRRKEERAARRNTPANLTQDLEELIGQWLKHVIPWEPS